MYFIVRSFLIESTKYGDIASTSTITQDLPHCRISASATVPLLYDEKTHYRKKPPPKNLYFDTEMTKRKPKSHRCCNNLTLFDDLRVQC